MDCLVHYPVQTKYCCGRLKVYVQGDLQNRAGKIVFLSIHDVGCNHTSFVKFFNHPSLVEVRKKVIFLHVCLPGQDDNEAELPDSYDFPSLDGIAHDLLQVLLHFNVNTVIGFAEAAGANILCRFALFYPNRCLGVILLDCTSSTAKVDEVMSYKAFSWKEDGMKLVNKLMSYASYHKLGTGREDYWADRINAVNVSRYMNAYLKRTSISKQIQQSLKVETLMVTGSRAPYLDSLYAMNRLNPRTITLAVVDGVGDVLFEAPRNLARALILFCKSCGVLIGVPMLGLEKEFEALKQKQIASKLARDAEAERID